MPATTYRPSVTAIAANGGCIRTNGRFTLDAVMDGKKQKLPIDAILYNSTTGINIIFMNKVCIEKHLEKDELEQVEDWILNNCPAPDFPKEKKDIRTEMIFLNQCFINEHGPLEEYDFQTAEALISAIEAARKGETPVPLPGDIVEGAYYNGKHPFNRGIIDTPYLWQSHEKLSICAQPYVPFAHLSPTQKEGYGLNTSGGPFLSIPADGLEYIGKDRNTFCDWGHNGPCGDGNIRFTAAVNRWRIKDNVDY